MVTQSAMAFAQLMGAFSVIINQFQSISSFAAVTARLDAIGEAIERKNVDRPGIETVEDRDRVAYERLTLRPLRDDGPLLYQVRKIRCAPIPRIVSIGQDRLGVGITPGA